MCSHLLASIPFFRKNPFKGRRRLARTLWHKKRLGSSTLTDFTNIVIKKNSENLTVAVNDSFSQKYSRLREPLWKFSFLYQSQPIYEGRLKVLLLLQVSSHDFEPTFIILVEYCQTSPNKNKSPNLWHVTSILVCCIFADGHLITEKVLTYFMDGPYLYCQNYKETTVLWLF